MEKTVRISIICLLAVIATVGITPVLSLAGPYNPLEIQSKIIPAQLELSVYDTVRQRSIPIRVYLPPDTAPAPVVLFSHGLGGSREGSAYLGKHWSARGYLCVFLQHPGSDTSTWKDKPPRKRLRALKQAVTVQNFLLRAQDVTAVLDQLEQWNKTSGHALSGRLDLARIGMSGHSFGAVTTQAVSGQQFEDTTTSCTDPRIKAAIMFSPSAPRRGNNADAFAKVKIPWLLMTGTKDVAAVGGIDLQSRLAVFPALPPGSKYELVLNGAEHSAFGDRTTGTTKRNPNYHRAILALSTAFWDAYLRKDDTAKSWLDGTGPRSVLEKEDRWQQK